MIRLLIFASVVLLVVISVFLLKKSSVFLPLMPNDDPDENRQFLHQFGVFYLILAAIGLLVGVVNLTFFSLFYIFGLLVISTVFSVMLAKKIL
ncbi:hypothetical protein JZO66_10470 [Enterococcus sp. DIV0242_7C1]|uniref:Major facilitator superfamily (MFS) profile domain-containing protein n=1 Tax=Candidatus Enterococcus dunnyi TaxID=1834192 RepID=A0A200J9S0_9ENTE|nr:MULTISPECIES: hypothetical protein [unclassified Enterococcus]MBO0470970.1 hypothetical protein [Enterococcus sp. DIV0242_7C1]OUZ33420.1 hypothetical protein A5889_002133 [Enterococcus sp. 9D6_DIV0238]